jgi:chromosome segregation ATPase
MNNTVSQSDRKQCVTESGEIGGDPLSLIPEDIRALASGSLIVKEAPLETKINLSSQKPPRSKRESSGNLAVGSDLLSKQLEEANQELDRLKAEAEQAAKDNSSLKREVSQLNTKLEDTIVNSLESTERVRSLEAKLRKYEEAIRDLKKRREIAKVEIHKLTQKLERLQADSSTLN